MTSATSSQIPLGYPNQLPATPQLGHVPNSPLPSPPLPSRRRRVCGRAGVRAGKGRGCEPRHKKPATAHRRCDRHSSSPRSSAGLHSPQRAMRFAYRCGAASPSLPFSFFFFFLFFSRSLSSLSSLSLLVVSLVTLSHCRYSPCPSYLHLLQDRGLLGRDVVVLALVLDNVEETPEDANALF